ncbi:hypothetical protein ACFFRR_010849 [Megaselia abdita]
MNEHKVLIEFKEKFNPFVEEDEASEAESLEPGELKSPIPSETSKPSPSPVIEKVKPSPKVESNKNVHPPLSSPPSPLISLARKNLTKGIITLPVQGSCTEKYESLFHGSQTIYKIAPALPVSVVIPAPSAETETPKKKADADKEKSGSSKKTERKSSRSKSRDGRRRRSGSIIKGSGGFIRKGKFKLISMESYRGGRGRNNRFGRGAMSRHPSSRFRPATAEDRERGREEKKRRKHEIKSKDIKELPNVKWTKSTPSISYSFNANSKVEQSQPVVKSDVKVDVKPEAKVKKEEEKKEEPKKSEKKEKKAKKAKKAKKVKKKKKAKTKKKSEAKEENTTPSCTPPPSTAKEEEKEVEKVEPSEKPVIKIDLVDYEVDDDEEDELEMEIIESFPLAKDLVTTENEKEKEESPNTEEYVDNWENEEDKTPLNVMDEEDSFKDGFSTPIFVNPSPPADHKFNDQSSTQEILNGSNTPPIPSTSLITRKDSEEPETRIFKPSKQLFGIDDIYSDVLNSINRSQARKPCTPSSSSSSSESEEDETPSTPPIEMAKKPEEPENPYANFSEEDLAKIQKLDENLSKIQSMRLSYGDPADEFCEGLNKMEKFLTTARNITIQKYSSTPQFLVTLQEAELKDDQSPSVFQSSIKMVISPTKISKNRIKSGTNLLGSDDDDEVVETEKEEIKKEEDVKKEEEKEKPKEEVKKVVKEEKKKRSDDVVEVKKERKSTRSPDKKDRERSDKTVRKSSKGKSESPNRRRRSRSPKVVDKGHRRDRHVVDDRHKRRSKSRSISPRRHSSPARRSRHRRSGARSRSRSFSPRVKRRRSRSRSRGFSRSPLPFKPPSPPPLPPSRSSTSASPKPPPSTATGAFYPVPVIPPYNDVSMAYNAYGHYGYMTMPVQSLYPSYFPEQQIVPVDPTVISSNANVNVCDFGPQSHLNQNPSVIKELPKATTPPPPIKPEIAVQKGNVLEIVPKEIVPLIKIKEEKIDPVETEKPKIKVTSLTAKRKEVEFRYINTAVLRLRKENDDPKHGILKVSRSSSDEEPSKPVAKAKKKSVLFEDGIKPNEDSEEEDRRDIEQKVQRKLRRLKKKFSQLEKENMEQQIKRSASDDEWDKMTPPPPPPGSPPPHLEQPVYLRPDSPPSFTYFLYDSLVNALYTAGDENALPPRLLYGKDNPQSCLPSPAATPPIGSTPPPPVQKPTNGKPPPPGSFSPNLSQPPPNFFMKIEPNTSSPLPFAGSPPLPFIGSPHMQKNQRFPNAPPMHPQFFQRMQFPPHLQPTPFTKPPQMAMPPGAIPVPFGAIPMGMPPFCGFSQPPPSQEMMFQQQQIRHFQPHMTGFPIPPGAMAIQPPPHILPPPKKKSRFNN